MKYEHFIISKVKSWVDFYKIAYLAKAPSAIYQEKISTEINSWSPKTIDTL